MLDTHRAEKTTNYAKNVSAFRGTKVTPINLPGDFPLLERMFNFRSLTTTE